MVDIRARALRQDNKTFTGPDEGRTLDDTVTVLGDKTWAVKALIHATRSNLESFWRAKESGSYNAAVSSLELVAQSVLKLAELYKQVRVERIEETHQTEKSEGAPSLKVMMEFMDELRAHFAEFCPGALPESAIKRVKSRDDEQAE